MRSVSIRILTLAAAVASIPLLAQQPSSSPQSPEGGSPQSPAGASPQATPPTQTNPEPGASEGSNPKATPVPSTGNSPEISNPQLRPVTGELENKLDTKDAKAGDAVAMKTTSTATTASGIEIPKGSEIKGHIVDVAPKGQQGDNSRVTIQFDQAQLKNGQSLPIRSVIQSVAPPGSGAGTEAMGGPPATGSSNGGVTSGSSAASATGSAQPNGGAASTSAAGAPASAGGGPAAGAQAGGEPAPGTVIATRGNLAIKTTAVPGVLLVGDVNGRPFSNASGALLGAKQDVHLDGGTVMVVAIMTGPAGIPGHGQ